MYKNYNMNQMTLPLDLEVIIPEDDISLAVNALVESIQEREFGPFDHAFGASSYHPRMMMKIILCSYAQSVTSGRKLLENRYGCDVHAHESGPYEKWPAESRIQPAGGLESSICFGV